MCETPDLGVGAVLALQWTNTNHMINQVGHAEHFIEAHLALLPVVNVSVTNPEVNKLQPRDPLRIY